MSAVREPSGAEIDGLTKALFAAEEAMWRKRIPNWDGGSFAEPMPDTKAHYRLLARTAWVFVARELEASQPHYKPNRNCQGCGDVIPWNQTWCKACRAALAKGGAS